MLFQAVLTLLKILSYLRSVSHVRANVEVEAWSSALLECPLAGDYTFPRWTGPPGLANPLTSGSIVNEEGMEFVESRNLRILAAELKHMGAYRCDNGRGQGQVQLAVFSRENVSVQIIEDSYTNPPSAKDNFTVTCIVSNAYPEPDVRFEFPLYEDRGADVLENRTVISKYSSQEQDKTFTVNLTMTFMVSHVASEFKLTCIASFPNFVSTPSSVATINMNSSPGLWIWEVKWRRGGLNVMHGNFTCYTTSLPASYLSFELDGERVPYTRDPCNQKEFSNKERVSITCKVTIELKVVVPKGETRTLTCVAMYNGKRYSSDHVLESHFLPSSINITGNTQVALKSDGTGTTNLACEADESNPTSKLQWYEEEAIFSMEIESGYNLTSVDGMYNAKKVSLKIDLPLTRAWNGRTILCCADQSVCANLTLDVQYKPVFLLPLVREVGLYRSERSEVKCAVDSNPPARILWVREGETLKPENAIIGGLRTLVFEEATEENSGNYTCHAWWPSEDISTALSKTVQISVAEGRDARPALLSTTSNDEGAMEVRFSTGRTDPHVFRRFYILYTATNPLTWAQIEVPNPSGVIGPTSMTYTFPPGVLERSREYSFVVNAVETSGRSIQSSVKKQKVRDRISETDEYIPPEETVSESKYRDAILISVFVTAAGFIIIIIIIVCVLRKGNAKSERSNSYVM